MAFLVRTRVGNFHLENAYTLEELTKANEQGKIFNVITSVEDALSNLPVVLVKNEALPIVESGNWLFSPDLVFPSVLENLDNKPSTEEVKLYTEEGKFLGIYKYEFDFNNLKKQPRVRKYGYKSALKPIKVFAKGAING
jgi:tRNA pseudouridine55 synthase